MNSKQHPSVKSKVILLSLILLGLILLFVILFRQIIPVIRYESRYQQASALIEAGKQEDALRLLKDLGHYKDSDEKRERILLQKCNQETSSILLGRYETDNRRWNGKESLRWTVLAVEEDRVLLVSRDVLDCRPYHTKKQATTWEQCSLRKWLNTSFFNDAFSREEQKWILETRIEADKNPETETPAGKETTDKVFLLSTEDLERYWEDSQGHHFPFRWLAHATDYAAARGLPVVKSVTDDPEPSGGWWLRTPGGSEDLASFVDPYANINSTGYLVSDAFGVRPAVWVSLKP